MCYTAGVGWLSSQGEAVTERADAAGVSDFRAHILLFEGLGFLLRLALRARWPTRSGCGLTLLAALATLGYGLLDEWHQSFVPGRGLDAADLQGNLVGALAGPLAAAISLEILRGRGMD